MLNWLLLAIGLFYVGLADRRDSSEPLWLEILFYFLIGAVPLGFTWLRFPLGLVTGPLALGLRVRNYRYKLAAALVGALVGWYLFFWLGINLVPPGGA